MLSTRELVELRAMAQRALPDVATITRRQRVSDGSLGTIETLVPIATNIPCRVDEDNDGRMAESGGTYTGAGELTVRLAYGTPLAEGDQIEVHINHRVRRFHVERVVESSFATVLSARVTEVR